MASWWQKTLVGVAGLAGLVGGAYFMLMHRPLPKVKGELSLRGLHEPVEIITDRYGVPHIYAQNEDDLFFAQGYVHAYERLWQMELNRRISSGRLSEIFGTSGGQVETRLGGIRTHGVIRNTTPFGTKNGTTWTGFNLPSGMDTMLSHGSIRSELRKRDGPGIRI